MANPQLANFSPSQQFDQLKPDFFCLWIWK